jgi:hypothetical protein
MTRRNPWTALLWVIGCVLVVGAAALQGWTAQVYFQAAATEPENPVQSFFLLLAGAIAPPAALVGVATMAGLLFLHARRRSRPPE